MWVIRANHRALYELEQRGGGRRPFQLVLADADGSQSFYYDLLWAMSATHRAKAAPDVSFEEWLEELPTGAAWDALVNKAYELLALALPRKKADEPETEPEEGAEGNLPPAPSEPGSEPIGTTEST